jgi:integrase
MKVTIEAKKYGHLLRWVCPQTGKRVSISVNEAADGRNPKKLKDRIENDIRHGDYDPTRLKYRPHTIGKTASEISAPELFDRFTQHQFKQEGLAKSSIKSRYHPVKRMLEKHLNIPAANVDKRRSERFADVCEDTLTAGTAKARIMLLKSAWEWGRGRYQLADENPWVGIATRFKSCPVQPVAAFTKDESKKIIEGFRNNRYYCHYADFVSFRLGMGTRGGEASALKWKHIKADFSSVWIGESYSRGTTGSTKTKKARTVVMPDAIASMLKDRKQRLNPQSDDELVFKSPTGLPICDRMFNRRAWKTVLADVGVKIRRPYTTRKTAISHALAAGANYIDVAAAAGHDPQTMHKHYAEAIQKGSVFVSFE